MDVEEAENAPPGQLVREPLEPIELAGRIAAADHRADRGAGDDSGLMPASSEARSTPICAQPRAAPPPSATPSLIPGLCCA